MFLTRPGLVGIKYRPDLWYLDAPLDWGGLDGKRVIRIPAGLITDLASVPAFLGWIPFLDRMGDSRLPGAFHDGLYVLEQGQDKAWCDDMLYMSLVSEGMSTTQSGIYRNAVGMFGRKFYDQDRKQGYFGVLKPGNFFNQAYYTAWKSQGTVFV